MFCELMLYVSCMGSTTIVNMVMVKSLTKSSRERVEPPCLKPKKAKDVLKLLLASNTVHDETSYDR